MKKVQITVEAVLLETREEQGHMLHSQLASGEYDGNEFRLIMPVSNTKTRMEYKDLCLDITTQDLGLAMIEAILTGAILNPLSLRLAMRLSSPSAIRLSMRLRNILTTICLLVLRCCFPIGGTGLCEAIGKRYA